MVLQHPLGFKQKRMNPLGSRILILDHPLVLGCHLDSDPSVTWTGSVLEGQSEYPLLCFGSRTPHSALCL